MFALAIPLGLRGWEVMWAICVLLYIMLKLLTWCTARRENAPSWKHWVYLLAWPGMDAEAFLFKASIIKSRVRKSANGASRVQNLLAV